jgi:hypothetical protein
MPTFQKFVFSNIYGLPVTLQNQTYSCFAIIHTSYPQLARKIKIMLEIK